MIETGRGEESLLDRIRREILDRGPISFARFMDLALHDPELGYYSRGGDRVGPAGDFVTASDSGRDFGRCVARQLQEIDRQVGPLRPFDVVEFGSGRGLLARDVLDSMAELDPELSGRLRYVMVERSPRMRSESSRRVPEAEVRTAEEPGRGYRGCLLAVELFDAVPVHRVARDDGDLEEIFVDYRDAEGLVERRLRPSRAVREMARRYGAAAVPGTLAEVAPAALQQLDSMARTLDRGCMIVVDYGDRARELYGPARPHGTLLAYHRHTTNRELLARVGEQDLTAHVNFSALEDRARETGLDVLGLTTQDRFLIACGILEVFEQDDLAASRDPRRVKQRLQALQLIHPDGMGRVFKVLVLAKGCDPAPRLGSLRDPFARDAAPGRNPLFGR